ncbi:type II toxin-antitoxin system RelE family toxin [Pseudonocardia spinosispora]|uniref:type II toxin-antitoxin system RelE family toxin n=1 Tax=Pseudonocardia spinosispora TaxID=103441 RepID=UPI0003FDAB2C|nr:type II toxin-antitoxin system RelE/ParE family toxin [Pseudonocardia spinosispora]
MSEPYRFRLSAPAARAIHELLPESVAAAVVEFIAGSLIENPHRVGKPLGGELKGKFAARRGVYRVIYRIDEATRTVLVVQVDHRGSVYRPR